MADHSFRDKRKRRFNAKLTKREQINPKLNEPTNKEPSHNIKHST